MRDNTWLRQRLLNLYQQHFSDVTLGNDILVRFGRAARRRLGSIGLRHHRSFSQPVSVITVNRLLATATVPTYVIDTVLAHELVHYVHGFSSSLPCLYRYPHQNGVVDDELRRRGLGSLLEREKRWTKTHFLSLLETADHEPN